MITESESQKIDDAPWLSAGVSLAGACAGAALLAAIHQLPGGNLFSVIPTKRIFFIFNFVSCTLIVFGVAGCFQPQLLHDLVSRERRKRISRSKSFTVVVLSFLSLFLSCCSLVVRLVFG